MSLNAHARAALSAAVLSVTAMPTVADAKEAAKAEPIATSPAPSVQSQLAAQAAQIEEQRQQIQLLQDKLNEVSSLLATRVDRVEAATENGRVVATNPGPKIESPGAKNTFTFLGGVQATVGLVEQNRDSAATPQLRGGSEIRRARIGVQGTAFNDFAYQAEIDLAQTTGSTSAAARDLWVQYNGFRPFAVTIGNMKPQTGLEASLSDRSNAGTFIEPALTSGLITATGARNIGIRVSTGGAHWSGSVGFFGDDVNNNGVTTADDEGSGWHWRLTYAPIATPKALLHVGTSGYYRNVATGQNTELSSVGQLRLRSTPEYSIENTRLVDTGNLAFADEVSLYALEAATMYGPVGLQAEWVQMDVSESAGRPDLDFNGAYVSANWFLTGESRVYDPRTGLFTRFKPRANVDPAAGYWGAWEFAARWSTLDLNSKENLRRGTTLLGVRGGEETNYTLGVNWYWNPYFRMMLNYVNADVDRRSTAAGLGARIGGSADAFTLRVQQEW